MQIRLPIIVFELNEWLSDAIRSKHCNRQTLVLLSLKYSGRTYQEISTPRFPIFLRPIHYNKTCHNHYITNKAWGPWGTALTLNHVQLTQVATILFGYEKEDFENTTHYFHYVKIHQIINQSSYQVLVYQNYSVCVSFQLKQQPWQCALQPLYIYDYF